MNHLKILASALLVCVLHLSAVAQIPDMESRINITALGQPRSVAADGYGQHIVYETFGTVTHKLIGNDGAMISSHSNNLNVTDAYSPVVNAHNGKVYVAMINGARNLIKLRLSLDGGARWIPLPDYPITPQAVVSGATIDAFTDDHGVHVVWSYPSLSYDTNNKVHYIRYDQTQNTWVAYKQVTDLNAQGGIRARVITSGNTAVVAFLHIAGPPPPPQSHWQLTSRDLNVPANTWASFYYQTPPSEPISFTSLNLARIGSTIYAGLTIYSSGAGGGVPRRIAQRDLSANWVLSNLPGGAEVALGASQSNLFVLSNRIEELIPFTTDRHNMELFQWPSGFYWLLHQSTVPSASYSPHSPKLPTSQTGVYSFWTHDTFYNNQLNTFYYLQRKPVGLSGSVSYNAFWTGNNWISGRTDIESNAIVRIRNGAVKRILANQWIVVHNGSALICEGGSIIAEPGGEVIVQPGGIYVTCGTHEFLGPGACISTTGGTIQIPDDATLRVNNGGVLFTQQAPGTIELGKNAKIIIDADGTLLWNSDANWIFGENATVEIHGKVKVGAGITLSLPSGSQFECYPGARFEMGDNSTIAVAGRLSAVGNQENPVVFTLQPVASNWNGVGVNNSCQANLSLEYCAFDGAANAVLVGEQAYFTMSNCVIENSSIGVQITPYLGDCPVVPAAKYISNNSMANVGMGIFLNTVAETHITSNTLLGQWASGNQPQELSAGVRCVGSSPRMLGNRIEGFGYGLHAMDGSSPELEDGFSGGHNVIRNNYIGVKCQDESHAVLGFLSGAQWDEGGQNSIYGNQWRDVVLVGKCVVFAQNNWWGSSEDPSHQFSIEDGSELFYEPWLEEDPNQGNRPFAGGMPLQQGKENADPRLSPFPDPMRQALAERSAGRHANALGILRLLVANRQLPDYARRWAISQLIPIAQRLPGGGVSAFLRVAELAYPNLVRSSAPRFRRVT